MSGTKIQFYFNLLPSKKPPPNVRFFTLIGVFLFVVAVAAVAAAIIVVFVVI